MSIGRSSESFTGSKEVAAVEEVEAVEAVYNVDVDVWCAVLWIRKIRKSEIIAKARVFMRERLDSGSCRLGWWW
jgi:hypothetical protein